MKKHNDLSDTPIAQADIDNGKLKLVKRKTNGQIETDYLFCSPANVVHLMESIAQLKAGKTQTHKLVKMKANMQAGDLPIDSNFEDIPPAGRELINHIMKKHLLAFTLIFATAFINLPAYAGFDEGLVAIEKGDYATALKEFKPLAEKGLASAQYNLGVMYVEGQGVTQDYVQAASWYRKAAEQGNAFAQSNLGAMYYTGQGVTQDYVQAHKWFNLAGANGEKDAVEARDLIEKRMNKSQIEKAQALASAWRPKK